MKQRQSSDPRPLTLAEICQAIANGNVVAEIENDNYVVRARDLVRLARQPRRLDQVAPARPQFLPLAS